MLLSSDSFDSLNSNFLASDNNRPNTKYKLVQRDYSALNAQGSMHVLPDEYTPKGNHTRTFDGRMECRADTFNGTFTNSKGKKFEFKLIYQSRWQ